MFEPLGPFDPWLHEICFPGVVSGEAEVNCPHCQELITVAVDDPMGVQVYRCPCCDGVIQVEWGE